MEKVLLCVPPEESPVLRGKCPRLKGRQVPVLGELQSGVGGDKPFSRGRYKIIRHATETSQQREPNQQPGCWSSSFTLPGEMAK